MTVKIDKYKQFVFPTRFLPVFAIFLAVSLSSCKTCKCPAYSYQEERTAKPCFTQFYSEHNAIAANSEIVEENLVNAKHQPGSPISGKNLH